MSESAQAQWLQKVVTKRVLLWWAFLQKLQKQKNKHVEPGLKKVGFYCGEIPKIW
jgi:hypothetical protein